MAVTMDCASISGRASLFCIHSTMDFHCSLRRASDINLCARTPLLYDFPFNRAVAVLLPYTPDSTRRSSIPELSYSLPITERKFSAMWKPPILMVVLENSIGRRHWISLVFMYIVAILGFLRVCAPTYISYNICVYISAHQTPECRPDDHGDVPRHCLASVWGGGWSHGGLRWTDSSLSMRDTLLLATPPLVGSGMFPLVISLIGWGPC